MTILLTEQDIEGLLSIEATIPVIEEAYRFAGEGTAENPARFRMPFERGFLQLGPAALHTKRVVGLKMWANFGSPLKQVWNFLFSLDTSELLAIIQAHQISKYRTSATTAVAVRHLSPESASVVGLYGTGRQAEAQLEAITKVRRVRRAVAYSRGQEGREAFCRKMSERLSIDVVPADRPEDVPTEADIVVTITKSDVPVLKGEWLTRPALVVGAGANHWHERELDEVAVAMAKLIVVDEKEQAKVEGGDLLWPIAHGLLTWDRVEELGDVVIGRVPVPAFDSGVILFEAHGLAISDIAISAEAYDRAKAAGVGREIAL